MSDNPAKSNVPTDKTQNDIHARSNREKLGLLSLEPRILLDAAGFVTGAEVAIDAMAFDDAQIAVEAIFNPKSETSGETMGLSNQGLELLESLEEVTASESLSISEGAETVTLETNDTHIPLGYDGLETPNFNTVTLESSFVEPDIRIQREPIEYSDSNLIQVLETEPTTGTLGADLLYSGEPNPLMEVGAVEPKPDSVPLSAESLDTDGDGVSDDIDIDDDNDGILDSVESGASASGGVTWNHNDGGGTSFAGAVDSSAQGFISGAQDISFGSGLTPFGSNYEHVLLDASASTYLEARAQNDYVEVSFTLSASATLESIQHGLVPTAWGGSQAGNYQVAVEISSDGFATSELLYEDGYQPQPNGNYASTVETIGATLAAGEYTVRFYVFNEQNSANMADGTPLPNGTIAFDDLTLSFTSVETIDTDGDGIADHLDIDSDNDGITDNIEAQTTSGYIAPNADDAATYTSNNGLNSAYVPTNGLTPVDTDSDGMNDVHDTDSDNEGASDALEAGFADDVQSGLSDASTDADGDGLFDVFENGTSNDGFIVNDGMVPSDLPDADNDADGAVPLTQDLDYRDSEQSPPSLDLDLGTDGIDYETVFIEDGTAQVLVALNAVDVQTNGHDIASLQIFVTPDQLVDGENEIAVRGQGVGSTLTYLSTGQTFMVIDEQGTLELQESGFEIVVGATTITVSGGVDPDTGRIQFTYTEINGNPISEDVIEEILTSLSYQNTSQDIVSGLRTFGISMTTTEGFTTSEATARVTLETTNDAPVPVIAENANGTVVEVGSGEAAEPILIVTPESAAFTDALTEADVLEHLANGGTAAELGLISVADLLLQLDTADIEQSEFGIGIISANETHGTWQYLRTDVEGHQWTDFQLGDPDNLDVTPVPDGEALLMDADAVLRFIPDAGFPGAATLNFRVWDGTVGTASNPPSTVTDDSGGAAPFDTSSLSSAAF
ncbi:MAG: MSCRAMM family adhesin SdrC, partial [Acidiferrobacterales bacterium]|nr:MSCRAMM family adhesin SdrC [Acidiferrobacterales bacterium]